MNSSMGNFQALVSSSH